jgi:hypothetical protein
MGAPDMTADPKVQSRVNQLVEEATQLLEKIRAQADSSYDPFTDPAALTQAVTSGLMDAPQLRNNKFALGKVKTHIVNGACVEI